MGHHNRHFAGDRYALLGAWSPPTSTANFCEEDYVVSRYIAEFMNSMTNLPYVYFALRYMYGPGSRGLFRPRTDFMSVSLLYADELGMLGLAWALLQGILTVRGRSSSNDRLVNTTLNIVFPLFAAFYVWTGKIIYHASAFFIMMVLIVVRVAHLFFWRKPTLPEDKVRVWNARGRISLALLVLAYVLWNIDLEFCAELRQLRERVGLPWAWLLELHGWWHIMTAMSASQFMDTVRELQEVFATEEIAKEEKR
ncbi:YPC1-alkaline Ceramidase [Apiospora phragmitis]|uniref:YPC1-alkaline Ceramidase n=1 Tax=Apiospora phragmitis TaxID=2905665 RepID=A0ABR1UIM5_9PEZI